MLKLIILILLLGIASLGIFFLQSPPDLRIIAPFPVYQPLPPTPDQIFSGNHQLTAGLPAEKIRTLIATGDIIPARAVNFQVATRNNFNWPYLKTADLLKSGDLTFINLEAPLIKNCPPRTDGMVFCGDERNIQGLLFAGVDIANLANNHAGNFGTEGIDYTTKLLNSNNIMVTGRGEPAVKEVRGLKFAFLGYNDIGYGGPGISAADPQKLVREITQAKSQADILVVTFHWGVEYISQPTERQRELAHLAIDSGADLIIGNHPHWIQPIEFYQDKQITYAHGNFVFDQMWSEETKLGVVGKYTFFDKQLIDVEFFPIRIEDYGQPYLLEGDQKQAVLEKMKKDSLGVHPIRSEQFD